ncbi:MAG: glycoside hydrolase family 52 protein [Tepidisphaerales bacterium]
MAAASPTATPFRPPVSFHAQHSPIGAFLSFTCGLVGKRGGLAQQLGRPADQDLFVGVHDLPLTAPPTCFPFFEGASDDPRQNFAVAADAPTAPDALSFAAGQYSRDYRYATDTFTAGPLTWTVYTPFEPIPDPDTADPRDLARVLLPAVRMELTLDNRHGKSDRAVFFAMRFQQTGLRPIVSGLPRHARGFALRRELGLAAYAVGDDGRPLDAAPDAFCRWTLRDGLTDPDNPVHRLANTPGFRLRVPAGQRRTLRIAVAGHLDGIVTTGLEGRYLYTRYHPTLESVLAAALDPAAFDAAVATAHALDHQLDAAPLPPQRKWLLAHAVRSYHGSTQLLDVGGRPFWVVNEGEYCMMNTLDLSVDHMFWELRHNPWVVRNLLDHFAHHYSYTDTVGAPGEPKTRPGGLSFAHDMGVHNQFAPRGTSSYELTALDARCFSHMTAEELCNYILLAATYVAHTRDHAWAGQHLHLIDALGESLLNRCGPTGIIAFDSSRCGPKGAEITTYDSLDHSLAQTRNNLYMAVKTWASFLGIRLLLRAAHAHGPHDDPTSHDAFLRYAHTAAETVRAHARPDGTLPAVFEPGNPGHDARILPALEALAYPLVWGEGDLDPDGHFASLVDALKRHLLACLHDPAQRNRFPGGGIRLSSTSNNTWLSKIFLLQFVAERLGFLTPADTAADDTAHVRWLTTGESAYWAFSDQIIDTVAQGSKYYPRGVTAVLWLGDDAARP